MRKRKIGIIKSVDVLRLDGFFVPCLVLSIEPVPDDDLYDFTIKPVVPQNDYDLAIIEVHHMTMEVVMDFFDVNDIHDIINEVVDYNIFVTPKNRYGVEKCLMHMRRCGKMIECGSTQGGIKQ